MARRDSAFMRWRYGTDYRLFVARHGGQPVGYAAARLVARAGLRLGLVVDCLGGATESMRLLQTAANWMKDQGASAAVGYFLAGSASSQAAIEAGFVRLPRYCTPRSYPVYVSVREGRDRTTLLDASRWHMTLADSDLA
jgi:hypothetical protein